MPALSLAAPRGVRVPISIENSQGHAHHRSRHFGKGLDTASMPNERTCREMLRRTSPRSPKLRNACTLPTFGPAAPTHSQARNEVNIAAQAVELRHGDMGAELLDSTKR